MVDAPLDRIDFIKHRIGIISNKSRLVQCVLYQTGPRAREFENTEIDKILKLGVFETTETEFAACIVLAPKM